MLAPSIGQKRLLLIVASEAGRAANVKLHAE